MLFRLLSLLSLIKNNTTWWSLLTLASSHHTRHCWWWNSCFSGSGWWVHSPGRVCTSAGSGPLWSDCPGRAHTGHPLHSQSHIPEGINERNTLDEKWGRGLRRCAAGEKRAWMWTTGGLKLKNDLGLWDQRRTMACLFRESILHWQ